MANLTITAASVFPGSGAVKENGVFGETVTAGQVVYKKASDGKFWLADSNVAGEVHTPYGIALNGGAANQSATIQTSGQINIGALVVVGESYYLSDTPGAICPEADLASGEFPTFLGFGVSTTTINLNMRSAGVAVP